jgi:hypothetical protein
MKRATLTLTIDYEGNPDNALIKDLLHGVADLAAGNGMFTGDTEHTINSWDAKVDISGGEPEEEATGPRVLAHFQPQAWVNDYAVEIDGAYTFDVTKQIEQMGREAALEIEDNEYSSDDLWHVHCDQHPGDHHDGPFRVTVEEAIKTYFEALDASNS